jgi:hypothetical protein
LLALQKQMQSPSMATTCTVDRTDLYAVTGRLAVSHGMT